MKYTDYFGYMHEKSDILSKLDKKRLKVVANIIFLESSLFAIEKARLTVAKIHRPDPIEYTNSLAMAFTWTQYDHRYLYMERMQLKHENRLNKLTRSLTPQQLLDDLVLESAYDR